jgi:hypothetical protein
MSLRRWVVAVFCALLLAAPASNTWLASPVGVIVAPDGGCEDGACGR